MLTRLGGQPMAVNPDLIEKAEATPDTVITLVDGHKFVVSESVPEVVDRVRAWRASVAAEAFSLSGPAPSERHPSERHPSERHPCEQPADVAGSGSLARVLQMPARED